MGDNGNWTMTSAAAQRGHGGESHIEDELIRIITLPTLAGLLPNATITRPAPVGFPCLAIKQNPCRTVTNVPLPLSVLLLCSKVESEAVGMEDNPPPSGPAFIVPA
jgi:hypothetical protein